MLFLHTKLLFCLSVEKLANCWTFWTAMAPGKGGGQIFKTLVS